MDAIDGFLAEVARARDACINILDGFSGHVKGLHGQLTLAAEELDRQQRLGAAMRERNRVEQERVNKEIAEANTELTKIRRECEGVRKEIERERAAVRAAFDDIFAGKKVA
jgi:hypothetical protein